MKKLLSNAIRVFLTICIYFANLNAGDELWGHKAYYQMSLDKKFTDFEIVSRDGTRFACHKMVLFSTNQYWQRLFNNPNCKECSEDIIYLPYSDHIIQIIIEMAYMPDKKFSIGDINIDEYLYLFEFADMSLDKYLMSELLGLFKNIVPHEDIEEYIIQMIGYGNKFIISCLNEIKDSFFVNHLKRKYGIMINNILEDDEANNESNSEPSKYERYYQMLSDKKLTDLEIISKDAKSYHVHKMVFFAGWTMYDNYSKDKIYLPYSNDIIEVILRRLYLPEESLNEKIIIGDMDANDYLNLLQSSGISLKNILYTAGLEFQDDNILVLLNNAIKFNDYHSIDQIIKYIKDRPTSEQVHDYLIQLLKEDNHYVTISLQKIKNSMLIRHLIEKDSNLIEQKILQKHWYVLDMKNWSKEDIENELNEDKYKQTLNELVQKLQLSILDRTASEEIDADKLLSIFMAHYAVNISLIANVLRKVVIVEDRLKFMSSRLASVLVETVDNNELKLANKAVSTAAWQQFSKYKGFILSKNFIEASNEVLGFSVEANFGVFSKGEMLALNGIKIRSKATCDLAQLFVLAYMTELDFQQRYFQLAYESTLNDLKKNPLNLSKEEIINNIAAYTWEREDLAENPFIQSLKQIMIELASR